MLTHSTHKIALLRFRRHHQIMISGLSESTHTPPLDRNIYLMNLFLCHTSITSHDYDIHAIHMLMQGCGSCEMGPLGQCPRPALCMEESIREIHGISVRQVRKGASEFRREGTNQCSKFGATYVQIHRGRISVAGALGYLSLINETRQTHSFKLLKRFTMLDRPDEKEAN